ncbi:MAG TPA: SPOR domain-containing protein [Saprospiraceae bacterium]|nr:SPOR domain-containing protein [Saprospiraceae bacterium]
MAAPSLLPYCRLVLSAVILSFPFTGQAQQVVFREEPAITRMINAYVQANRDPQRLIDVWRVQISATVDRRQMEQTKSAFKSRYQGYTLTSSYDEPYYKLRVGAYVDKRKAQSTVYALKADYPGAYLTRDKAKLSELTD